ncbi:MAG: hypothetical protein WDZ47_00980 [Bacteroidales bacterium]
MKTEQIKKMPQFQKAVKIQQMKSAILTEKISSSIMEFPFQPDNKQNVETHLCVLAGGQDQKYIKDQKTHNSLILQNKGKQKELEHEINVWRLDRKNTGHDPAEPLAEHLVDRQIQLMAEMEVYEMERQKLEKILKEFDDQVEAETAERMLRGSLGSSKLRGGMVSEIDGQRCGLKDKLLHIQDPRSPYDNMVLHRYIGFVVKPFLGEENYRSRMEIKAAKQAGRAYSKQNVKRPALPKWNKETDKIEYPGYSEKIINKFSIK